MVKQDTPSTHTWSSKYLDYDRGVNRHILTLLDGTQISIAHCEKQDLRFVLLSAPSIVAPVHWHERALKYAYAAHTCDLFGHQDRKFSSPSVRHASLLPSDQCTLVRIE